MKIYKVIWVLIAFTLLSACATSQKAAVGISKKVRDSVTVAAYDTTASVRKDLNVVSGAVSDSSHVFTSTMENGDYEETITERIVESQDSFGNKTTTTDRTIKRKNSFSKQADTQMLQRHKEEQTALLLNYMDSVANHYFDSYWTHWMQNDSTNIVKEKSTKNETVVPWWLRTLFFLFVTAIVAFIAWSDARKHKNE
jgi:hypothetical protein